VCTAPDALSRQGTHVLYCAYCIENWENTPIPIPYQKRKSGKSLQIAWIKENRR
jgi:hypothetical protein